MKGTIDLDLYREMSRNTNLRGWVVCGQKIHLEMLFLLRHCSLHKFLETVVPSLGASVLHWSCELVNILAFFHDFIMPKDERVPQSVWRCVLLHSGPTVRGNSVNCEP